MSVKIRMKRIGRRHRPFFRINAIDSRSPRDGKILERLGHYDPIEKNPEKQLVLNVERVKFWLDKGAEPSETIGQILARKGITNVYDKARKARRTQARQRARKAGLPFTKAEKMALQKAAEAKAAEKPAEAKPAEKK